MWPDRVSNPGPLTCESGALPIALRGPASFKCYTEKDMIFGQNCHHEGRNLPLRWGFVVNTKPLIKSQTLNIYP